MTHHPGSNSRQGTQVRLVSLLALSLLFHGCAVVPKSTAESQPRCQTATQPLSFQIVELVSPRLCSGGGGECVLSYAGFGALTLGVTALASGGIVLIGNAANWVERKARCERDREDSPLIGPIPDEHSATLRGAR
jgi:hypothetical protein